MKRISLWLMLSILVPGVCEAYGYGSYSCGVRYTPYAFSYRHSGLVSGYVDYTPYALTYRNSGLVPGYGVSSGSYSNYSYLAPAGRFRGAPRPMFRGGNPMRRHAQDTAVPVRPQDGIETIRQYLTAKGCNTAQMNQVLRIDNNLVSVDFLLKDRNLLIKYWNPREIELLSTKEGFKQKAYQNYRENWTQVAAQHEQNGGQVVYVEASDAETIVAALDSCSKLEAVPGVASQSVLYAKE